MTKNEDRPLKELLRLPLIVCGIILGVFFIEKLFNFNFGIYGIYPRYVSGLFGIISSPFLHSGWQHIISNIFPMLVLTTMMEYFYRSVSRTSMLGIYLLTGFLVWMFGRNGTIHIGASGVVYGLISFVFFSGLFRGNTRSIILTFIVLTLYGSYFEGLAPKIGISWESHLYGAFSGIFFAFLFRNALEKEEVEEVVVDNTPRNKFLHPSIFQLTKVERARIAEEERLRLIEEEKAKRLQAYYEYLRSQGLTPTEPEN